MHRSIFLTVLPLTTAQSFSYISQAAVTASQLASTLISTLPNPSIGILPSPYWWWESGTTLDALLTYMHTNSDPTYNALVSNTLLSQTTSTNDFMVPGQATGNDDQAWWALAAMSAAEYNLPAPAGTPAWANLAANAFATQKSRWQTSSCGGGLKWKINAGDQGYNYRSTISNALFFQLAARLARYNDDGDALAWAEKSWGWMSTTGGGGGVVTKEFDVFDGTDDKNSCGDVNHDLWSYNTGAVLYGAAVMASHTNQQVWKDRAQGLLDAVKRNFVKDGALFEGKCEGSGSCNADQVAFKGILARWLGASASVLPGLQEQVGELLMGSEARVTGGWQGKDSMGLFTALEVVDALKSAAGMGMVPGVAVHAASGRRSVAGRIRW